MKTGRKYGVPPYRVAVIHGGPGGPGQAAPVAKELSAICGILEPLQTKGTIDGQVEELLVSLNKHAEKPVILIGHSWGAMLGLIFAARYPAAVEKLILISCPPLEEKHAAKIMKDRLDRFNAHEKNEIMELMKRLNTPETDRKNDIFAKLAHMALKADSYDPIHCDDETIEYQYDIFSRVWREAETLRSDGMFTEMAGNIKIPVIAIHGDHDPHPYKAVQAFFSPILKNFEFILLEKCGHYPWIERAAKDRFFDILKKVL